MTTTVYPNEILFRLNEDGEVTGCHRRDIKVITDGTDTFTKELDPVPITGDDMDAVLGVINSALTATLISRDAQVSSLSNQIASLNGQIDALNSHVSLMESAMNQ